MMPEATVEKMLMAMRTPLNLAQSSSSWRTRSSRRSVRLSGVMGSSQAQVGRWRWDTPQADEGTIKELDVAEQLCAFRDFRVLLHGEAAAPDDFGRGLDVGAGG